MTLSAAEAARRLGVKPSTLYTYVSRGWLTSLPGSDGRSRRYDADEVRDLRLRSQAGKGHRAVAAGSTSFGQPVLDTSIFDASTGEPRLRDEPLAAWLDAGLEAVAEHLWQQPFEGVEGPAPEMGDVHLTLATAVLARARQDPARHGVRRPGAVVRALVGPGSTVAAALADRFGRPDAVNCLDRALVVCAEHGLTASTFAARVAASTGADLYHAVLGGLAAHSGPRHGNQSLAVMALLDQLDPHEPAEDQLAARLARGEAVAGLGHRLYPDGDPRFRWLFEPLAHRAPRVANLVRGVRALGLPEPNLDLGLAAVVEALSLPEDAGVRLFAVGRSVGWLAHALEQQASRRLIRPRSRYLR